MVMFGAQAGLLVLKDLEHSPGRTYYSMMDVRHRARFVLVYHTIGVLSGSLSPYDCSKELWTVRLYESISRPSSTLVSPN